MTPCSRAPAEPMSDASVACRAGLSGCMLALGWSLSAVAAEAPVPGLAWKRHVIDNRFQGADGVRVADVNRDGRLDVATGWEQDGVVRVYLQPAPARTKEPWPAVTVGQVADVEDAFFVDLDGDGAIDVVSSGEGQTQTMFVHWAPRDPARLLDAAAWRTEPIQATRGWAQWLFAAPADLDDRNGVDLIAGSKGRTPGDGIIGWLESPADPRRLADWRWHELRRAGWVMGLEPADMDGDGDLDVVCSERFDGDRGGCFWLENPGAGATRPWREHRIGLAGKNALFFCLVDLDRDGLVDVCVGTQGTGDDARTALVLLRRLDPKGDRWSERVIDLATAPAEFKAVSAGDVDLDGRTDLVVSFVRARGRPGLLWFSHEGAPFAGRWTQHELSGVDGVKRDLVGLLDLDADGDLDAITTEEVTNRGVIWYENPTKS